MLCKSHILTLDKKLDIIDQLDMPVRPGNVKGHEVIFDDLRNALTANIWLSRKGYRCVPSSRVEDVR